MKLTLIGMQQQKRASCRGFTLIEMLVVIVVIAILATIALPVLRRSVIGAQRTDARSQIVSLEAAILGYFNEYGRFPNGNQTSYLEDNRELLEALRGGNPRQITFMRPHDRSLSRDAAGEVEATPNLVDPWGEPYQVLININYPDQAIPVPLPETNPVHRRMAIWSLGEDVRGNQPRNYIKSWE